MTPSLYWIDASWPGRFAITARPRGGDWLESEVEEWKKSQIDVVVSLLTRDEIEDLGLTDEGTLVEAQGMRFLSFPIQDRGIPPSKSQVIAFLRRLRAMLEAGRCVVIHCRQSVGRSGLIAAALLICKGETADEAIQRITSVRGVPVPETSEQRLWLLQFSKAVPTSNPVELRTPS